MQQIVQVSLVSHETKEIHGQHGPYTLHIFRDTTGQDYVTSKAEVANQAFAAVNAGPVNLIVDRTEKPRDDGGVWVNFKITGVANAQGLAPAAAAVAGAPVAAPQAAAVAAAPAVAPGNNDRERQLQIMRQHASQTVIQGVVAGIFPHPEGFVEFLKLRDALVTSYQREATSYAAPQAEAQPPAAPAAALPADDGIPF